ncbi:MAG: hypothetical protein JOZ47_04185 [Kutzneria sp.]|nr:hypothetical protein [Kutzneria sp.]MBV9844260.1 hypothetical protein [Kutzneria sp.]
MQEPRNAASADFPYTLSTVCYIEVSSGGTVTFGRDAGTYERARSGASRLYAVWPGQYRSDLFVIDDLDDYARAFGIVHDERRTGLADHEHRVRWSISPYETNPNGSYVSVEVRFDCGCEIKDLAAFAKHMREQKGWAVATSTGFSGGWSQDDGHRFSVRVRRTSLRA